ncbi:MAG TPA: carboxypeptidase-like regulatory domain-containing protein, partial [Gemmatimonadaceae bacterium]|nr:carboxypeptidase-like regulatory domain-containing protein [Gemmatimonadaceae bacterium]
MSTHPKTALDSSGRARRLVAAPVLGLLVLTAVPMVSRGQGQATPPSASTASTVGSIHGTVIDSIRDGVLSHAIVQLYTVAGGQRQSAHRETVSDAAGRYQFDSVPAGTGYQLHVEHALLDTIGIDLWTPDQFTVKPGEARIYDIYTPTPGRIVGQLCSKSNNFLRGTTLLTGFVRDPDTDKPLDSARVSYLIFSKRPGSLDLMVDTAMRTWPRDSETVTGRYRFCGLPAVGNGTLVIERNGVKSQEIQVNLTGDLLVLRSLGISRSTVAVSVKSDSGFKTVLKGMARMTGKV